MEFNQFKEKAFEIALAQGCDAAELYYVEGDSFSAMVLEQELDSYSVSRGRGLNLRVQLAGKNGYAYTETLDAPEALVQRAMDNARAIENDDDHPMQGKCEYRALPKRECRIDAASEREKIELAMALERAVKVQDTRVNRVMRCGVGSDSALVRICNTLGLDAEGEECAAYSYAVPIASAEGQVKDGFAFRVDDGVFDVEGCAKEAVSRAVAQLGGAPVPAGKYRILFENQAMADLLSAFSPMFSADAAQKGLSLLAGKEGETVAASDVTILDDPFDAVNPRAFDAEGVPCATKAVVEGGVLKTLLHNLKTAKKAGVPSTGNGGRAGAAAPVGVMPTNFFLKPGTDSYETLVEKLENGLIITDVSGLHAGLNTVSGEFSLLASGKLVEKGKTVRAVEQITVSGSFLSLMRGVEAVGSDLRFGMPGASCFGSPSVLVGELSVSGK